MSIYAKLHPSATAPNSLATSTVRISWSAEEILGEVFRSRDLSLAREPSFRDRAPSEQPKRLGEIVDQVVGAAAQRVIRHWQKQGALALTESERQEALEIAGKIARAAGLDWPEDREAA